MSTMAIAPDIRQLITGGDPDERYPVPLVVGDYADAPDLAEIGDALIQQLPIFAGLRQAVATGEVTIRYLWRRKATTHGDRKRMGQAQRASGLIRHAAGCEYLVMLAADLCHGTTRWFVEALVYHELRHIKISHRKTDDGEDELVLGMRGHDLELFLDELERYGLWRGDLRQAAEAFGQLRLPMDGHV